MSGEDIDSVNDKGWTAARFAIEKGNLGMLTELVQRRININIPDSDGFTCLMAGAARNDHMYHNNRHIDTAYTY
jgi:ankyrin repeat protein